MVSLSRHDPSACPPKEGALRTMLARLPRASMGHEVLLTSITLRFVSASHFGTHLISSISLSFHTLTVTPFCNPFVFMVFHLMGGVYPCSPAFQSSSSNAPKSFICNTYAPLRKCCKQKTYDRAKSFSCNTYKKQGGAGYYG